MGKEKQKEFRQKNREAREAVLATLVMAGRPLNITKIARYVRRTRPITLARVRRAVYGLTRLGLARRRKQGGGMRAWARSWR